MNNGGDRENTTGCVLSFSVQCGFLISAGLCINTPFFSIPSSRLPCVLSLRLYLPLLSTFSNRVQTNQRDAEGKEMGGNRNKKEEQEKSRQTFNKNSMGVNTTVCEAVKINNKQRVENSFSHRPTDKPCTHTVNLPGANCSRFQTDSIKQCCIIYNHFIISLLCKGGLNTLNESNKSQWECHHYHNMHLFVQR